MKNKKFIEFLLCLFLGLCGAHRLYKKQPAGLFIFALSCFGWGLFITIPWVIYDLITLVKEIILEKENIESERNDLFEKYSGIIDIEAKEKELNKNFSELQSDYNELSKAFSELEEGKEILKAEVDLLEVGIYEPHFDFGDSEKFKEAIKENVEKQKELIKNTKSVKTKQQFIVNGSVSTGKQIRDRIIKLMIKSFNAECDNIIETSNWTNIQKNEDKVKKIFADINKMGEKANIALTADFLKLKREQLFLCYEFEETKKAERERQKEIQQAIREEQKAIKEAELAQLKAEKEKADFEKALQIAHEQLAKANEAERTKFEEQIAKLQEQLKEVEEKQQRALSMAQQTKCGHVYIISNIGSFGENIYKIGLTRRLEPMERVDELGDASVPFKFDVHALIYSDDAPALENELHRQFDAKRVNKVNNKKEFFNVTLKEIEQAVKQNDKFKNIEFKNEAEAREYRESLAIARAKQKI